MLGFWVAVDAAATSTGWSAIVDYAGNNGTATMSMGVGLTVVLALFIDAGTVSADFNRWAKTAERVRCSSTFSAFPFANLIAMLVGGVMTAALAVPNANPFGNDNMFGYMNGKQIAWLSALAFLFLYCNLGSVCSHCLYNAATGWSRILRQPHAPLRRHPRSRSASSSRRAMSGPSSSNGCRCSAFSCRRSAPSASSTNIVPAERTDRS